MVSRPLHPLVGAISHRFARGTNDAAPSTAADWHIASRPVRIGKQAGVSLTQCPQTRLLLPIDVGRLADARLGADFRNPAHERLLRVRTVMASSSSVCCRPSHPADSRSSDKNCRVGVRQPFHLFRLQFSLSAYFNWSISRPFVQLGFWLALGVS